MIINAILLTALIFFVPQTLYKFTFPHSFRLAFSVFTDFIIISSYRILIILILFISLRKIRIKDHLFQKIEFLPLLKILRLGIILGISLVLIGIFIPRYHYDPMRGLSSLQRVTIAFLVAPVVEELACRGLIQSYLHPLVNYRIKVRILKLSLPVLISAFLFSIPHVVNRTPYTELHFTFQLFNTFISGIYIGYYFEKTRNITVAILAHITLNVVTVFTRIIISVIV